MSLSPPDRIEDSLDNININKLKQSSQDKFKTQLFQTKHRFVTSLEKLQST